MTAPFLCKLFLPFPPPLPLNPHLSASLPHILPLPRLRHTIATGHVTIGPQMLVVPGRADETHTHDTNTQIHTEEHCYERFGEFYLTKHISRFFLFLRSN